GATGRMVLEALVASVEVMCRVGLAVPGALHARHFHPTAIAGSFAAAAAAAKLNKLSEDQLVHAFGICGSQASGIIEYLADGSWTKRLHPGWAAHAGVTATLLARSGFTGPETVFDGLHGLCAWHLDMPRAPVVCSGHQRSRGEAGRRVEGRAECGWPR
ncbi:MAG: MmgE/PrpD family protein, partial [candidate division NC10 bacterium]